MSRSESVFQWLRFYGFHSCRLKPVLGIQRARTLEFVSNLRLIMKSPAAMEWSSPLRMSLPGFKYLVLFSPFAMDVQVGVHFQNTTFHQHWKHGQANHFFNRSLQILRIFYSSFMICFLCQSWMFPRDKRLNLHFVMLTGRLYIWKVGHLIFSVLEESQMCIYFHCLYFSILKYV